MRLSKDTATPRGATPGRARRAIAVVAKTVGLAVVFALSAAGGVVLHMNLGAPRRFATARLNGMLEGSFAGKIAVRRVGWLRLTTIGGLDAEVFDPEGRRVLDVHGARMRIGTLTLLRSLAGGGAIAVRLPELDIDGAEVVLEENAAGELGLSRAFDARAPSPGASRAVEISVPEAHLGRAWVHGHMAAVPVLDADLSDLAGAFASKPDATEIEIRHLYVHDRGLAGMSPDGVLEASASLPSGAEGERRAKAHFEGRVGQVPVRVDGSLTGKDVAGVLDVLETAPGAFAALAPGRVYLGAPVSAHAEVHGRLPVLSPRLHARVGAGEIDVSGLVTLPEEPRTELVASATVDVKDIDASAVAEGAPPSRLTARLDASVVSRPGGKLAGSFDLESREGEVSGQLVPAARVRGTFTERSARGSAQIAERGAPTTLSFSVDPRDGGAPFADLALALETTVPDLGGVARIGTVGHGRAHVVVDATMDLETKRFSANAAADVSGLDVKGVRLSRGALAAEAEGPLASPRVHTDLRGVGLLAGGYGFTSVRLRAGGPLPELAVSADLAGDDRSPSATVRAHVAYGEAITVRGAVVQVARGDARGTVNVAIVRVAGGAIDVQGLRVLGLGEPVEASARIEAGGVTVKARGADVDLARVAALAAPEEDARGHLALDVDATLGRHGARGKVDVRVRDLSLWGLHDVDVQVSTSVEGPHVRGEILASLGEVGKLDLAATDIVLGGPATDPRAWRSATGAVSIAGNVDLARLLAWLPKEARPVEVAAGKVAIQGKASRPSREASPGLELSASTEGLAVVAKQARQKNPDGSVTLGPEPWHTEGLDGDLAVKLAPSTGRAQVSVKLHDARGALASVEAGATLPIARILEAPGLLATLARDLPLEATIDVPRRSLDAMPAALGKLPIQGDVELTARLHGTSHAPHVELSAKGTNLRSRDAAACVRPVGAETTVSYDGKDARVRVAASLDGREVAGASATVKAPVAQVMAGGAVDWDASGEVTLTRFPLDLVGALTAEPVGGYLSGKVAVKDLHRAASLDASLDLRDLSLDRSAFPRGEIRASAKDGVFSASVKLDQADGSFATRATGAVAWGTALAPSLDLTKPVDVAIQAKNFRADAATPFVRGVLTDIDGRVDTDAKLHVDPGGKDGRMDGFIAIRDGVFEAPQIGEKFHAFKGRLVMKPWGTLRLDDVSAEAPTGKLTASASAVLKGLTLESAEGKVHIAKGESIPITLEGVPMGRAYGDVTTRARMSGDGKRLDIDVDIPVLHVDLPQSTGHTVQPLEPDRAVRVGHLLGGDFVTIPLAAPEKPRPPSDVVVRAAVKLGSDVEVKRDTTIDIVAQGEPRIEVKDKAHVSGQIRLVRGRLELEGKQFVVDNGTVSFVGDDPADPMIVATAHWDGPDGTRVSADFDGRVTSGKLSLRSEPALTQDEILALILFGAADGSFGAEPPPGQQESTGVKAAGMAGGVVTQGLNKAISGITAVDITTRVDTSDANGPRPELAVQISKSVSTSVSYKLGVPPPGQNPDRTLVTLDWRFIRDWSLTATVGDQGSTALDVMWRRRY